jgi:hypothetical protein
MKKPVTCSFFAAALIGAAFAALPVHATGLATCDSGPAEKWQRPSALEKKLVGMQWKVRRIKVDGGCYEVYGLNEKEERVEAYFHPVTLEPVPTKAR